MGLELSIKREPALVVAVFAAAAQFVLSLVHLGPAVQGWGDAIIVALAGFIVAAWVKRDGQVAAFTGLVKAVLSLCVGLGLQWSDSQQALFMALVTAAAGLFVRTQVGAPVGVTAPVVAAQPGVPQGGAS